METFTFPIINGMKKILLSLLQKIVKFLAILTLKRYNPGIIGITGNIGKTSAKEAVGAVLSEIRRVHASSKSFNNEIGLPLSILGDWNVTEGIFFWIKVFVVSLFQLVIKNKKYPEIIVLEYGVDRVGDMKYLLDVARPHIGVFTAMGNEIPVHIEFFAGPEVILREKTKLLSQLPTTGFAILNIDDEKVMTAKEYTRANVITFGFSEKADMRMSAFSNYISEDGGGVTFKLTYGGSVVPVRIEGGLGRAPAYAAAVGAIAGLVFGMNLVKIADALSRFTPPRGRERIVRGIRRSIIIDDTYNASPAATKEALATLKSLDAKRKIAVLGDMLELGKYTFDEHQTIGHFIPESADFLFTVGIRAKIIAETAEKIGFSKKKIFAFTNIHEAAMQLQQKVQRGDLILVKGSQGVRMERVVKEIMAEPLQAKKLLVRQSRSWLRKAGLYD
jgi:UDP-N-acetylmuramoyl-tripeptide--D-alanyl-D-alanine ligase